MIYVKLSVNILIKTNRRVTFEYIMLKGVNDDIVLFTLVKLLHYLRGLNAYVNLIPYNMLMSMVINLVIKKQ